VTRSPALVARIARPARSAERGPAPRAIGRAPQPYDGRPTVRQHAAGGLRVLASLSAGLPLSTSWLT